MSDDYKVFIPAAGDLSLMDLYGRSSLTTHAVEEWFAAIRLAEDAVMFAVEG